MEKPKTERTGQLDETDLALLEQSGFSPSLKRTIQEKLERGELDEVDHNIFEENLKKAVKKRD